MYLFMFIVSGNKLNNTQFIILSSLFEVYKHFDKNVNIHFCLDLM